MSKEVELTYSQEHSYYKKMRENAAKDPFYVGTNPVINVGPAQAMNGIQHWVAYSPNAVESGLLPFEYTGWDKEMKSWHETCYIHANLNPSPTCKLTGPDSMKFLEYYCANSFKTFPVGTGKHGIMCDENGMVMIDGVLIRTAEEEFWSYWMNPWMQYCAETCGMNVKAHDMMGKVYLYQLGGPKALEIVEAAAGENLHDVKFFHLKNSKIAGKKVMIVRVGMAGALAYEVHGDIEDSREVYDGLLEAGVKYGLVQSGTAAYQMTHTENGFPQAYLDFPLPWFEHPGFSEWLMERGNGLLCFKPLFGPMCDGSLGPGYEPRYRNPIELGWGKTINFDHDFYGRKALEKIAAAPHRVMVTLEWNIEDCLDVIRSQFEPGESYMDISDPDDASFGKHVLHADKVLDTKGKFIGIATNRIRTTWFRKIISLCSIDKEFSVIGTEVVVLWGNPGTRQKHIRAIVALYPYNQEFRNQKIDINQIPVGTMG